jgi:hypothetical protein
MLLRPWLTIPLLLLVPALAAAKTFYVTPTGDDHLSGNEAEPLLTLQRAADLVQPGDTVFVRTGSYAPFTVRASGAANAPIRFVADAGTQINANGEGVDAITLDGVAWLELEGFGATSTGGAGLRLHNCSAVTIRRNQFIDNQLWGMIADHCDELLVIDNQIRNSARTHGLYLANSGDRCIVRNNVITHNASAGIAIGGDNKSDQDGIVTGTLIEDNVVISNGVDRSASIVLDGAVATVLRNNVIAKGGGAGVTLQHKYGGAASTGTLLEHNTIVLALSTTVALDLRDAAVDTTVRNNILVAGIWPIGTRTADELVPEAKGAIAVALDSLAGLQSDYNVVTPRFLIGDEPTPLTLAQWQQRTKQEKHSVDPLIYRLFRDAANDNFALVDGSAAVDRGADGKGLGRDVAGHARPVGLHVDIGAYEYCTPQNCHAVERAPDPPRMGRVEVVKAGPPVVMVPRGCCGGGGPETVVGPGALVVLGWPRRRRKAARWRPH